MTKSNTGSNNGSYNGSNNSQMKSNNSQIYHAIIWINSSQREPGRLEKRGGEYKSPPRSRDNKSIQCDDVNSFVTEARAGFTDVTVVVAAPLGRGDGCAELFNCFLCLFLPSVCSISELLCSRRSFSLH